MTHHPFIVDFSINAAFFMICALLVYYLRYINNMDASLRAWVGCSIFFGGLYLCARLFHVSMVLIPINGGIPWDRPGFVLLLFLVSLVCTIYTFIKNCLNGNPWQKLNPP
jgi:hypothetical protein